MLNKVEICGVDTSKLPVIPENRLKEYFEKIYAGDRKAREEFIQGNLRLVLSIVQRFSMRGENVDDLFQIGCVGLMKAIDNFDIKVGVRFSTYACPMIIGEIRRYLRDNSLVRVSRSLKDTAYRAFAVSRELAEKTPKSRASMPSQNRWASPGRSFPSRWTLCKTLSPSHSPSIRRAATRSMCSTACLTKKLLGELAIGHRAQRRHRQARGPGEKYHPTALLRGQNPDGGFRRNWHQPGSSFPA